MTSPHDQNLIKIMGIESLPDAQKAEILDKTALLVEQRLLLRVYESLPEAKSDEFNDVIEGGDKGKLHDFLEANSPDFLKWVEEETLAVKDELADRYKQDI